MSAACSVASGASNSGSRGRDSRPSGSSRSTHTPKRSCGSTGPMPLFMATLHRLIGEQFQRLTSSPVASPARTSAVLERELASRGVVLASGAITPRRLGFYDPGSHSLRTYQSSLVEDCTLSLETLPRSGMMRNGIVYQLPALVRLTGVTESTSFPTPTVADTFTGNLKSSQQKEGSRHSVNLSQAVRMFPTCRSKENGDYQYSSGDHQKPVLTLSGVARMFPTPRAQEHCQYNSEGNYIALSRFVKFHPTPSATDGKRDGTEKQPSSLPKEVGGFLNPLWVEWLMGFPEEWTELDVSETPSSHKSRKSSPKLLKNVSNRRRKSNKRSME